LPNLNNDDRVTKELSILCGLIAGETEPSCISMHYILKPLVDELRMGCHGVKMSTRNNSEGVTVSFACFAAIYPFREKIMVRSVIL
jgi:hypothetical protein